LIYRPKILDNPDMRGEYATMTERILIVEDDEGRCNWFRAQLLNYELDITCDVTEAICWLKERDYQVIFLDHDLVTEQYAATDFDDERTGYAVAQWLAAHPEYQREAEIVIHSLNYPGAERMLRVLQESGRQARHIPFTTLMMDPPL
jgi:CheY-like chemotaxis protein